MIVSRVQRRWLLAHTLAIAFSLSHVMLDMWVGVLGSPTDSLSASQALILLISTVQYAMWAYTLVLASHGSRSALKATLGLAAVGSLNGFTIVFCLPPCFFPIGDLSHIGSLVFCLWAMFESWRALKQNSTVYTRQAREGMS
jgi:hypothetical protein